jgi:NAD(P)H dehydrogenase (quinone)
LSLFAAQHGMVWVGNNVVPYGDAQNRNRLGSFLGVMGQAGQEPPEVAPNESDKLTAESLGRRVAQLALKWR